MALYVLAASFPWSLFLWSSFSLTLVVYFLSLNLVNFPSRVMVVRNKCIVLGISPSVPYPFVELFSSAPPIINSLTTAQGLDLTHFYLFVPLVYSNLAIRSTARCLL